MAPAAGDASSIATGGRVVNRGRALWRFRRLLWMFCAAGGSGPVAAGISRDGVWGSRRWKGGGAALVDAPPHKNRMSWH